ncbi:MAG TPA: hypothetical protein VKC35_06990 [Vicinamibacterales bacterium]|nr:hypothetical protein [Vicinamibacterales bacterium]
MQELLIYGGVLRVLESQPFLHLVEALSSWPTSAPAVSAVMLWRQTRAPGLRPAWTPDAVVGFTSATD